jgi:ArsR family transcriptional regulator
VNSRSLESISVESRVQVLGALGDPIRLRILDLLGAGERCVCDLQETVGIAPNLLSYHLRVLREAGLVTTSRRGRWIDYRLVEDASRLVGDALPGGLIEG